MRMARAGESVVLADRAVTIHALRLVDWDDSDPDRPIAILDVECSAGTYVRALARDLGEHLGNAAYLGALRRTATGPFTDDAALTLDAIRTEAAAGPEALTAALLPLDTGLDRFPEVVLDDDEVAAVSRGQFVRAAAGFERWCRALPTARRGTDASSRSRPMPARGGWHRTRC